jgi:hypothetical protein
VLTGTRFVARWRTQAEDGDCLQIVHWNLHLKTISNAKISMNNSRSKKRGKNDYWKLLKTISENLKTILNAKISMSNPRSKKGKKRPLQATKSTRTHRGATLAANFLLAQLAQVVLGLEETKAGLSARKAHLPRRNVLVQLDVEQQGLQVGAGENVADVDDFLQRELQAIDLAPHVLRKPRTERVVETSKLELWTRRSEILNNTIDVNRKV